MSESNEIKDSGIAWDMAHAEKPFRDEALKLVTEGVKKSTVIQETAQVGRDHTTAEQEVSKPEFGEPEIKKILEDSTFVGQAWFGQGQSPENLVSRFQGQGFNSFANDPKAGQYKNARTPYTYPDSIVSEYEKAKIPEMITVSSVDRSFHDFSSAPDAVDEKTMAITYETVFRYVDTTGRGGNMRYFTIFLPESQGKLLIEGIESNPEMIHNLADIVLRDKVGAPDNWQDSKPPYDEWKATNGGVNRIAIRTDLSQHPEESQVLEF